MASGDAAVAAPTVWAMRTDKVYVEFQVIRESSLSPVILFYADRMFADSSI